MAKLTTCKDCGHQVSKNATQCPNCGAKIKRSSPILNIIVGIILFSIVWAMVKSCSGESHLHIMLRNQGEGNDVMFSIDKGQFHCNYDGCEISVKFDNEAVKTYTVNEADAGKNDVVFLASGKDAFIKKLKTSKKVIIEAPFFQEPRTQFDFDTAGLEWKH